MTRRQRNDKGITGGSVITGLRLEPELAARLRDAATEHAEGRVAVLARFLIATGLGRGADAATQDEQDTIKKRKLCGLAVSDDMYDRLETRAAQLQLQITGCIRHLLRVGLKIDAMESLRREETFASLAAALREVREAHR